MVRQFLQGQNFFRQEFGKMCSEVGGELLHQQAEGAGACLQVRRGCSWAALPSSWVPVPQTPSPCSSGCQTHLATLRSCPRSCEAVVSSASSPKS